MGSIITTKKGLLKLVKGQIEVEVNGSNQPAKDGEQLPKGAVLHIGENATYEITFDDGTKLSNEINEIEVNPASAAVVAPVTGEATPDEIQALQDLIASGEDPTKNLPETAAGNAPASDGNSGYVSLARDGSEALATSGYSTSGQTLAAFAPDTPEQSIAIDSPSLLANDSITIDEDSAATGNVLSNDSDIDSTLSVVSFTVNGNTVTAGTTVALEGGSLIINADGSYTFTPNANWNGTVPVITYTTNTGSTATLTINVTPVDDPSVLVNDTNTVAEDSVATGNVLSNDSDIDSTLSVVSFTVNGNTVTAGTTVALEGGSLIINADGSYTFTPNANWNGTVPVITYTTNTGATATLTINITPVDDPSVLVNDTNTVAEDSVATGNVLSNDSDIDSTLSVVSFTVNGNTVTAGTTVALEGGSLIINADGSYTFTPNANWNGTVPVITYTTNTGSTATLTINITPVDDPSVLVNDTNTVAEDSVATGNVLSNDSDIDSTLSVVSFTVNGNTVTAGTTVALEGGSLIINADGSYTFTPNANWNGTVPVITYTTNTGSTATLTINITPVDDPSVLVNDTNTVAEDSVATGNVLSNDSDIDSTLSVVSFTVNGNTVTAGTTVALEGGSLIINADGSYTFTPNANWNGQVPVITYTTNTGSTATLTINITPVDDPSVLVNDTNTVAEDSVATGNVLSNDSDIDSTLSVVSFTVNGNTVTAGTTVALEGGSLIINADGTYTFTPNANWNGQVPVITYTTNTGSTATLTINITPVDDPSVLVNDTNTVAEDSVATGNVLSNDSDIDSTLSVVSFTVNGNTVTAGTTVALEGGSLIINADGTYTFTPNANWNGQVPVITYTTNTGSTATLTIEVTPENDPVDAVNDEYTVNEDGSVSINLLANDSAPDGGLAIVSINGVALTGGAQNIAVTNGTVVIAANGSMTFVPNENFNGNISFNYVAKDADGDTDTATVSIKVNSVDDPVDAVNDEYTVNEDGSVSINLLANDSAPDGGLAIVSINGVALTGGAQNIAVTNGTVVIAANGSMTFVPNENFNGNISFNYVAKDADGDTDTATVSIKVNSVDDPVDAVNDEYTVNEDGSVSINLLANDSAPDGGLAIVSINGVALTGGAQNIAVTNGTVVIAANGSMTFVPNENFNGNISFNYVAKDADGDTDTATVSIKVNSVDDPVDAVNDEYTVNEDGSVSINLLANDSAPDGGLAIVSINGVALTGGAQNIAVTNGTVVIAANGSMTFVPNENFNGNISFNYVAKDADGDTDTATVSIKVNSVDDPVDAVNDEYTVNEDGSVSINLLANDSAPDGGLAIVSINGVALTGGAQNIAVTNGTVVIAANGSMTFVPNENFNGNISFNYVAKDADGDTDTATVSIKVNSVDDPVDAVNDEYTVNEDGSVSINLLANDSAPDGGLAIVSINGVALTGGAQNIAVTNGTVVIAANGSMTFVPNENFNGNISFNYVAKDADGDTDTATVSIKVNSVDDPVDAVNDEYTVNEDGSVSINLLANDSAPDGGLAIVSINGVALTGGAQNIAVTNGTVVIAANGSMTFVPNENFNGNISFNYVAKDADGDTDTATVSIKVNSVDDPVDAVNDEYTVNEDGSVSINLLANDSAPDGGLAIVSINGVALTGGAQNIAVTNGTVVIAANGSMTFVPNENFNGNISFNYVAKDADGDTDTATVSIKVNSVDDPVDAVNDEYTVNEDGSVSINLLANDSAPDGGLAIVSINGVALTGGAQNIAVTNGTVVIAANGSMTFVPNENFNGNISFNYVAKDADGDTDTATVSIKVNSVDDPVDAVNDEYTVNEDGSVSINLLANDSAPDGGLAIVSINGVALTGGAQNIAVTNGTVVIAANGSMTFVPNENFNGNISFNYVAKDADGDTDTATVSIKVNSVDDPVDAVNDEYTVNEDGSVSINLLANDSAPDGGLAIVSINGVALTGGAQNIAVTNGTVVIAANGSMTFVPNENFNGNISFNYVAKDADGDTDTATVSIKVNSVDDPVDAVNDEYTVNEDGSVSINLLANDSAPDGGLAIVSINGVALTGGAQNIAVTNGTVVIAANGSMTFVPNENFNGNISFNYVAKDADGDTDTATVSIKVNSVDDPVDAVNDEYTVNEDGSVSINLLANDSAPDGGLAIVSINGVALTGGAQNIAVTNGTVVIAANGSMTFVPNENFNGNISFNYVAKDADGDTDTATVSIKVNSVDDPVDAVNDEYTVNEDGSVSINLLANDSAPDGGLAIVSINGVALTGGAQNIAVTNGTVVIAANGSMTFVPNENFNGNISFNYVAKDADGDTDTATVSIKVNSVDDPVDAVNDEYTVNEDGSVSINLLANDSAPDGGLAIVSINGVALTGGAQNIAVTNGTVVIAANGSMTFVPNENFNGNISFNYVAKDADGDTDTATVSIKVNSVDDPVDAVNDEYTVNEDGSVSINLLANDSAPDGGLAIVSINGVALTGGAQNIAVTNGTVVIAANGSMTFVPNENFNGNISFNYVAKDADGDTDTATVSIKVNSVDDPVDAVNDEYTVNEDGSVSINLLANDSAPDGGLAIVSINGVALTGGAQNIAVTNGTVVIAANGSMTFVPNENFNGNISFNYVAKDADGDTDTATVSIKVNSVDDPVDAVNDEYTVNEDGSVSINLLANDSAPDGGLAIVSINGVALTGGAQNIAVTNGTVVIAANGSMTFVPNENFNGNISFNYVAKDADGDTDTATVSIKVNSVDDPVDAVNDEYTVNEDGSVSINLLANDSAPDGGLAIVSINGVALTGGAQNIAVTNGTVVIAANGSMTFVPNENFNGNISFNYVAKDADGDTDTATVSIKVNSVDDPVDAVNDEYTVNEDGSVSINLLANDSAPDGGLAIVSINGVALTGGAQNIAVTNGTVVIAANGSMTFVPNENFNGNISFNYVAKDADGDTDTATVSIKVNSVDDPVDAVNDEYTVNEDGSVSINLLANDSAPDGGLAIVSINGVALTGGAQNIAVTNGTVVIAANGSMTFVPNENFNGNISFNYVAKDADGDTDTATVSIKVNSVDDPVDAVNDEYTVNEDGSVSINLLANDSAPDGGLAIVSINGVALTGGAQNIAVTNGTVVIAANGSMTFVPNENFNGNISFNYVAKDADGDTDTATVSIKVNSVDDPVDAVNDEYTVNEDGSVSINLLANDSAPDGGLAIVSINGVALTGGAQNIAVTNGTVVIAANGSMTFVPNENFNGNISFNYVAKDADGDTDTATVSIKVNSVDDPVDAVNDEYTVNEDGSVSINLLANDSAPDGGLAIVSINGVALTGGAQNIAVTNGTVVIAANGSMTFVPNENFNGNISFNYVAKDADGDTDTATVSIKVNSVDDPVDAVNDEYTVNEDGSVSINLLANDSAPDGGLAIVSINGVALTGGAQNIAVTNGTVVIAANGSMTFVPNENFNGNISFNYVAKDADGDTDTATVSIKVNSVDDPVDAVNDEYTVNEDGSVSINLLANDSAPDGGLAIVSINGVALTGGAQNIAVTNGTVVIAANGSMTFVPNENFNGNISFNYVAKDADGDTDTATVSIKVNSVDDPVDAVNDEYTVNEDGSVSINLLANDSAPDGGLAIVSINGVALTGGAQNIAVTNGTVVIAANGSMTFVPNENFNGNISFNYVAKDADGDTDTATVSIKVNSVDDPVDAVNDEYTVNEDGSVSINLLANDSAPDGGLAIVSINGVALTGGAQNIAVTNGTVVIAANGSMTFVPNENFNGNISFDYVATDADGDTDTATVNITVTPSNDGVSLGGLNVQGGELTVNEANLSTGSAPNSNALTQTGNFSFTSVDGLASVTIAGQTFNLTALLALSSNMVSITTPYGVLTLTGFTGDASGGSISYSYTLNDNVDNDSATGATNTSYFDSFAITVVDTDGSQANGSLDVKIVDDVPDANDDTGSVNVIVDSFRVSGVEANWTNWTNGTSVTRFDGNNNPNGGGTDNDSGLDQIRWGNPTNTYQSGYGFIDNDSALNGQFALNQDIILGTFTHYNFPVSSGGAITQASMDVTFSVTDAYGVVTPVTLKVNFDHNETPNSNDPEASKDIIKVGNTNVTFEHQGQVYTLQVIGFRIPGTNQVVTEIKTAENAASSYELVVRIVAGNGYELPSTEGNVLTNDVIGADNDLTVVGAAAGNQTGSGTTGSVGTIINGQYGTLIIFANGSYTYTVTANASAIPAGATETFTYTMQDADGDKSSALLTINVNTVNANALKAAQDQGIGSEDTAVMGNVLENDGNKNTSVSHFTVANSATQYTAGSKITLTEGELTLNADGSYTFTPTANWNGQVPVITYTTNTGATSTLTIVVTPVNDPTVTKPESNTITEDDLATGNVLANDNDIDNTLSVTSFQVNGVTYNAGNTWYQLPEGTLQLKANGEYSFDPKDHWSGSLPEITYTTNTGATSTLNITVQAVADAPNLTMNGYTSVAAINFEDAKFSGSWDGVKANDIKGLNTIGTWHTSNAGGKIEVGLEKTYLEGSSNNKVMEIEFNNGDKTLYTDMRLEAGRFYELGFDIAARVNSAATSGLTIKLVPLDVNGNPIMAQAVMLYDFNPTTSGWLKDQKVTLPVGTSGNYRLLFEADNADSVGAIMDNLAFRAVDNMGYSGSFIKLGNISANLVDTDGSESLSIKLQGLPVGSVLTDGVKTLTIGADGTADISSWNKSNLLLKPVTTGTINITVVATATESSNNDKATTTTTFPVTVLPATVVTGGQSVDSFIMTNWENGLAQFAVSLSGYGSVGAAASTQYINKSTELLINAGASNDYVELGISTANNVVNTGSSLPNTNNSVVTQAELLASKFMTQDSITTNVGSLKSDVLQPLQPKTDTVNLGSGNDTVNGGEGSQVVHGGGGNDLLIGGEGIDGLRGGDGNDTLIGGLGNDVLRGDSGADTFVWRYADADKGTDHIMDFNVSEDKLDLSDLLQGETAGTLESYLSFSLNNGSTVIDIDANKDGTFDQHIVLDGVNLYSQFGATDNAGIINGLLGSNGNGPLIIDTAPPVTPDAPQGVTPLTDPHNNIIP